jgi:sulfur carrier protein ThiS
LCVSVKLKLYASLATHLPRGAAGNIAECRLPAGSTPADVLERFAIPPQLAHLVMINGVYVNPADRERQMLCDGDELAVFPPVAGG